MGKKLKRLLLVIFSCTVMLTTLSGCAGMPDRDDVKGKWKATAPGNVKNDIKITDNKLIFNGTSNKIKFTKKGFENDAQYLGFKFNGKTYSIVLPDKDNRDIAFIVEVHDEDDMLSGKVLFVMNRNKYPDYQKYCDKYLNE